VILNSLDLFAGIGGLSLGLERAGATTVGQVELDPFASRVLAKHWPDVPRHGDVRTALDWWRSAPRPPVDIVAGGYPCQPESTAGRQLGTADARWLWPEMARIVATLRPRYVLGENVMGHRTGGLRFVLRDLERLGYSARAGIVSAAQMGAPHQRKRIFIIADLANPYGEPWQQRGADQPEQGSGWWHPDRGGLAGHVADTDGSGLDSRGTLAGQVRRDDGPAGPRGSGTQSVGYGWWATEPDVGRVAYGVSGRVDRLRCLGNAVVPQVAEYVARLMLAGNA
jgi:DNA (cytosine-5)-methyltransferase 1